VAIALALVLVVGLASMGRALLRDRTPVVSTATPPPMNEVAPIALAPGQRACASDVVLTERTEVAALRLERPVPGPPRLLVGADGPGGYASPPVEATFAGRRGTEIRARITPPARELFGRLCAENAGPGPIALVGTEEFRTISRARTAVDGAEIEPDLALTFFEQRPTSLLAYLPVVEQRLTAFRGFLGHGWLVWPLTLLVALGVPAAVLVTLARALGDEPGS
jgi:hypothetical protein